MSKIEELLSESDGFLDKETSSKETQIKRAKKCLPCNSNINKKIVKFVEGELIEVKVSVCSECICPIGAKIKELIQNCDLNKW